ncbi:MAG: DUF4838 domain-containing protein [Clostridia bacterium]
MMKRFPDLENQQAILAFAHSEAVGYLKRMLPSGYVLPTLTFTMAAVHGVEHDGFSASLNSGQAIITAPKARGVLYGVYALLEKLGCRFTFPRPQMEVVPGLERLPDIEAFTESPVMQCRGLCLYGLNREALAETLMTVDWMAKNRYNFLLASEKRECDAVQGFNGVLYGEVRDEVTPELQKRGIVLDMSEHSTDCFFSRKDLYPKHPEWFALCNGKRIPYQMCYANEEATDYYAAQYAAYAAAHPEMQMLGVWPLDGGFYCQCEQCKNPSTVARAVAKVARAVHAVRPDLVVEHLAYTPQSYPIPDFEMEPNMCVLVCAKTDGIAQDWARHMEKNQGAYYFEYNTADNYRWRANVWIQPDYCRWIVGRMASMNYMGMVSLFLPIQSWWIAAVNYAFLRRAYWDVTFDRDTALTELCAELFGTGAEAGKAAFELMLDQVQRRELWQRFPHADLDGYEWESFDQRNASLDAARASKVRSGVQSALGILTHMDKSQLTAAQELHLRCFTAYIHIVGLCHQWVDGFDGGCDEWQGRLEPLFDYLEQLQKELGPVFITPEYARWRLIGRDNVFVKPKPETAVDVDKLLQEAAIKAAEQEN